MQIKCIIRFFKSFGSICWRLALTTPSLSRINTFMLCWVWSCVAVVIFVFFFCFHFLNNFPFILSFSFWVKDQKLDGWVPDQMLLCVKIASFTLINDELGLTALFHRCHNHNAQGHFVVHTSSFDKTALFYVEGRKTAWVSVVDIYLFWPILLHCQISWWELSFKAFLLYDKNCNTNFLSADTERGSKQAGKYQYWDLILVKFVFVLHSEIKFHWCTINLHFIVLQRTTNENHDSIDKRNWQAHTYPRADLEVYDQM